MSGEGYSERSFPIADKFRLKWGVSIKHGDAVVLTGNLLEGKAEVDKYGAGYSPSQIIGNSLTTMTGDYVDRAITINISGADRVRVTEDVEAFDLLTGSGFQFTELFNGSGVSGQQLQIENMPLSSVVSVKEGGSTVYTEVPLQQTPTGNQFNVDPTTGIITLGTSVSGTDNYEIVYNISDGRYRKLKPSDAVITETLPITAGTSGTLSQLPKYGGVVQVDNGAGTLLDIVYDVAPASGQVEIEPDTGDVTFQAAVTSPVIIYEPFDMLAKALALESKAAGEWLDIIYIHKH